MDIYKPYFAKNASQSNLVWTGRVVVICALVLACLFARILGPIPQMFQYIQEYTGIVSPGILAVFILGLFWKKTTTKGAITGILASIPVAFALKIPSILIKFYSKKIEAGGLVANKLALYQDKITNLEGYTMPFLDQMLYTGLITMAVIVMVSLTTSKTDDDVKAIQLDRSIFATGKVFNIAAYVLMLILVVLYTVFW